MPSSAEFHLLQVMNDVRISVRIPKNSGVFTFVFLPVTSPSKASPGQRHPIARRRSFHSSAIPKTTPHVDASVTAGDVDAAPWQSHGAFFVLPLNPAQQIQIARSRRCRRRNLVVVNAEVAFLPLAFDFRSQPDTFTRRFLCGAFVKCFAIRNWLIYKNYLPSSVLANRLPFKIRTPTAVRSCVLLHEVSPNLVSLILHQRPIELRTLRRGNFHPSATGIFPLSARS